MLRLWTHPQKQSVRLYFSVPVTKKAIKAVDGSWRVKDVKLWLESASNGQAEIFTVIKGNESIPEGILDRLQAAALDAVGLSGDEAWDELVNLATRYEEDEKTRKHLIDEQKRKGQHEINAGKEAANSDRFRETMRLDVASLEMSSPITIQVDSKESKLIENLIASHPKIKVERSQLGYSDFRIQDNKGNELLVERKRCTGDGHQTDFESSFSLKGRLFEQSDKLGFISENSDHQIIPIVILEGNVYGNAGSLTIHQIDSGISLLSAVHRLSVLSSYSANHSAYLIAQLAIKFSSGQMTQLDGSQKKPKALYEQKKHVLESLPGVSSKISDSLLQQFGSVKGVAIANEEELASVKGIGFKKAKDIIRVLGVI